MESTKLDRDTSTDSNERGERAFVKGECPFVAIDGLRGDNGVGIGRTGLKTHFYYVEWLAWEHGISQGLSTFRIELVDLEE